MDKKCTFQSRTNTTSSSGEADIKEIKRDTTDQDIDSIANLAIRIRCKFRPLSAAFLQHTSGKNDRPGDDGTKARTGVYGGHLAQRGPKTCV